MFLACENTLTFFEYIWWWYAYKIIMYVQKIVFLFFCLCTLANCLVFEWSKFATAITGAESACPQTAADAIMQEDSSNLQHCSEKTLRDFYRQNSCCASFLASCNLIEREWWQKTDIWNFEPICPFYGKLIHMERKRLRKNFMHRIRKKPLLRIFGKPVLEDDVVFSAKKLWFMYKGVSASWMCPWKRYVIHAWTAKGKYYIAARKIAVGKCATIVWTNGMPITTHVQRAASTMIVCINFV